MPAEKLKVLMVDDDLTSLALLESSVKSSLERVITNCRDRFDSFEIQALKDPTQVMPLFENTTFHLVFLDLLMPKIEGNELMGKIKQKQQVPIVITSGYITPMARAQLIMSGATACLDKPVDFKELAELIDKIFAKSEETS